MTRVGVWPQRLASFAGSIWGPLLITLALGLPRLRFPIGQDAAVFSYTAQAILNGNILYRDVWLHAAPLNPLLYAAFGRVASLNATTPHLLHLLESLAGVALIYVVGRLALSRKHGLFGAYVFGLVSTLFVPFDMAAEPESLAGLAGIVTTILLLTCLRRYETGLGSQCGLLVLGAGVSSGIAISAKPVALPLVAVGLFWIWRSYQSLRLRYMFYYALGVAIVPFALLAWLAVSGAIGDMVEQLVIFNRYYTADRGPLVTFIVGQIVLALKLGPVLPLAAVGAVLVAHEWNAKKVWILLWASAGVAAVLIQGRPWTYYWFLGLPAFSLLTAHAIVNARRVMESRPLFWAVGLSIAVSAISVEAVVDNVSKDIAAIVSLLPGHSETGFLSQFLYTVGTMADVQQVATYLTSHSEESDRVFVWMYSNAYIMSHRRPASKHAYLLPLVYGPERLQAKARSELMSDLRRERPPYIVLPASRGWYWQMVNVSFSTDPFPDLVDFVANNYTLEAVIAESAVYRLREPEDAASEAPHQP